MLMNYFENWMTITIISLRIENFNRFCLNKYKKNNKKLLERELKKRSYKTQKLKILLPDYE